MHLPRMRPAEAARLLLRHGFRMTRSSGAHRVYRDAANRRYVLSYHSRQELSPKAVRELLDLLGVAPEDV